MIITSDRGVQYPPHHKILYSIEKLFSSRMEVFMEVSLNSQTVFLKTRENSEVSPPHNVRKI
jgi:hypothetical protein